LKPNQIQFMFIKISKGNTATGVFFIHFGYLNTTFKHCCYKIASIGLVVKALVVLDKSTAAEECSCRTGYNTAHISLFVVRRPYTF